MEEARENHVEEILPDPVEPRTKTLRMINDVLVEPRQGDAPTKRKKRKAKRANVPANIGNIKKYFTDLHQHKEWSSNDTKEGGAEGRKRKPDGYLEQTTDLRSCKSRRLLLEETETSGKTDSRTLSPLFMGAKSGCGREPADRQNLGANGAGFIEKEGGISHGTIGRPKTKLNK